MVTYESNLEAARERVVQAEAAMDAYIHSRDRDY